MLIGGLANVLHGADRTTRDVDIVVFAKLGDINKVVGAFQEDFVSRVADLLVFAGRNFVLPLTHKATGIYADVSLGFSEFEKSALTRGKKLLLHDIELNVCTKEDLIIFKLVAGRPRDLSDVQEIIHRSGDRLDVEYMRSVAKSFRMVPSSASL